MIRRLAIGIALAVATLMAGTASYAKDDPTAAVPALITAGKVPCTLTASRFITEATTQDKDKTKAKFYELACSEGLGYVLIAPDDKTKPVSVFDCATSSEPGPDGKKGALACTLPANASSQTAFQTAITKLNDPCTISKTRSIGAAPDKIYFELACDSGAGYILVIPRTTDAGATQAYNCMDMDPNGSVKCTLTDKDAYVAKVAGKLLAASGKTCVVAKTRYVGEATDSTFFYEASCQAGDGYMLQASATGDLKNAIACTAATQMLGGCTLIDVRAAETEQNGLYTSLSKKAGFDCDVAKYGAFPPDGKNDIVELQCSNRPDGGVGVFPLRGGAPMVYDCLRSESLGYRCSYTKTDMLYSKLSAQLQAKGRGSCTVNGARSFGATDTTDLVEVSCSDGNPGWVIEYPHLSLAPADLLTCGQAAHMSPDGCQLPTNHKH